MAFHADGLKRLPGTQSNDDASVPKTMTAVRIYKFGGPEALSAEQHPVPAPEPNEVLVHVRASSVTGWDSLYRKGALVAPSGRAPLPMPQQLGREAAGEVAAVGRSEDNLCVRTAYPAHQSFGGYAEYVAVPEHGLLHAPDNMEFDKLACLLWSYGTAFHMVNNKAKIRPGESVLVSGASGGMGTACLQLTKLAGAHPIIALTGTPHKANKLLSNGADIVLDYHNTDIVNKIKSHTQEGRGIDLVLDNVGGTSDLKLVMDASRTGARLALVSFMAGRAIELDLFTVLIKELALLDTRGSTRREQETVLELAAAAKNRPCGQCAVPPD